MTGGVGDLADRALPLQDASGTNLGEPERRLSWSQLNTWTQCGEKYRLSYVEKVARVAQGALIGGIAVHRTIEWAEPDGWKDLPGPKDPALDRHPMIAHFRATLLELIAEAGGQDAVRWGGRKSKAFPDGENGIWWFEAGGPKALRRYAHVRNTDTEQGVTVPEEGIEMEVVMTLPSGTQVKGYVDVFLAVTSDGEFRIRDYKTGRPGGADPVQAAVYAAAIKQARGLTVDSAEFVYLKSASEDTLKDVYELAPLMPLVERKFADFERALDAEIYPVNESSFCSSCNVRLHCPYGGTLSRDDLPPVYRDLGAGTPSESVPSDARNPAPNPRDAA